jgi:hypothetical protein
MAERDATIRQLAEPLTGSTAEQAHGLVVKLRRYADAAWRIDRNAGRPTVSGRERELLFKLYTLDADPPTSIRHITNIIACDFAANHLFSLHE